MLIFLININGHSSQFNDFINVAIEDNHPDLQVKVIEHIDRTNAAEQNALQDRYVHDQNNLNANLDDGLRRFERVKYTPAYLNGL